MRGIKNFGVLTVILALSALSAGNASAAIFTASKSGTLTAEALEPRKYTVNGGTIECNSVTLTGQVVEASQTQQHVTLHYSGCKAFGGAGVHVSPATHLATADGTVHMLESLVMTVTTIFGDCTITFPKQTLETFDFTNTYTHTPKTEVDPTTTPHHGIKSTPTVTGMEYTSSGGVCGSSGTNGTLSGAIEVLLSGGVLAFDP